MVQDVLELANVPRGISKSRILLCIGGSWNYTCPFLLKIVESGLLQQCAAQGKFKYYKATRKGIMFLRTIRALKNLLNTCPEKEEK